MDIVKPGSFDKWLFAVTLVLLTMGLVMVFSASGVASDHIFKQPFYYLTQQALGAAGGLILLFVMLSIRKPFYEQSLFIFGLLAATFGLLVLCFLMPTVAKTNRWISFGGIRFQPSELAKISLVLFLAWYLDRRKEKIREPRAILAPAAVIVLFALLIMKEPDFGTALFVFLLGLILLFLGGVRPKYFIYLGLFSLPVFAYYIFTASYRLERILAFLAPDKSPQSINFQIQQSKYALGAGGLIGASLGESVQKLFLPYPHTDFIFAILGEEMGFLGTLVTLAFFVILIWRGVAISLKAPTVFSQLATAGLTFLLGIQALLNISVVLGLGPVKGVPLPFLSFGRSSLVCNLIVIGLLLHISQRRETQRTQA
jgi:cell division protein FtsW